MFYSNLKISEKTFFGIIKIPLRLEQSRYYINPTQSSDCNVRMVKSSNAMLPWTLGNPKL